MERGKVSKIYKLTEEDLEAINNNFEAMIQAFEHQNTVNTEYLELFRSIKAVLISAEERLKKVEAQLIDAEVVHIHNPSKEIH